MSRIIAPPEGDFLDARQIRDVNLGKTQAEINDTSNADIANINTNIQLIRDKRLFLSSVTINNGDWKTAIFPLYLRNYILICTPYGMGNPQSNVSVYVITTGQTPNNTSNITKIFGGDSPLEFNWNNTLSLGIHCKSDNWTICSIM